MSSLTTITDPSAPVIQLGENGEVILNQHIAQQVDAKRETAEPYPFAMPEDCMHGRAGAWARLIEGPLGPSYLSILCVSAGAGIRVADPDNVQTNLYGALVASVGVGKSQCLTRAKRIVPRTNIVPYFPGSHQGIAKLFAPGKEDPPVGSPSYRPPHATLALDELGDLLEACNTPGSGKTLSGTLCTLWKEGQGGGATKQGVAAIHAWISIVGPLAAANPTDFRQKFGVNTRGGLYDRFNYAVFPTAWKWTFPWHAPAVRYPEGDRMPDNILDDDWVAAKDDGPPPFSTVVKVPGSIWRMLAAWREAAPEVFGDPPTKLDRGRTGENAMRVAVITTSINGDSEVTEECMATALRFAEWQERIREVYTPAQSDDRFDEFVAVCEQAVRALQKGKPSDYFVRWRDLVKNKNWHRNYSRALGPMKKMLIDLGLLVRQYTGKDEYGKPSYDDGLVRWHEEV